MEKRHIFKQLAKFYTTQGLIAKLVSLVCVENQRMSRND